MKRLVILILSLGLAITATPSSQAAAKVFKNCTELNKVYPGGVALPGAVNKGGVTKLTPKYDRQLYTANKKSDRDKDGIACEKVTSQENTATKNQDCPSFNKQTKVGLAFGIGGRGEWGFNDSAALGLEEAIKKLCVSGGEVMTTSGSDLDREQKLYSLAKAGYNPIIAVGFLYAGPIKKVASDYPNTQFAIIDDASVDLQNVAGLVFAEEQGSYLAGVAAALATKSGKVGYIGGVRIPLLQKFEAGFVAGVKATKKSVTVDVKYVTEPPDFGGLNDPAKAKVIAKEMIDKGADVIYSAAGDSGAGNFAAATDAAKAGKKVWTIGVDTDQYLLASTAEQKVILTSVVKRYDVVVFDLISKFVKSNGAVISGAQVYGVLQGGLSLAKSGGHIDIYSSELIKAENSIRKGETVVPVTP